MAERIVHVYVRNQQNAASRRRERAVQTAGQGLATPRPEQTSDRRPVSGGASSQVGGHTDTVRNLACDRPAASRNVGCTLQQPQTRGDGAAASGGSADAAPCGGSSRAPRSCLGRGQTPACHPGVPRAALLQRDPGSCRLRGASLRLGG